VGQLQYQPNNNQPSLKTKNSQAYISRSYVCQVMKKIGSEKTVYLPLSQITSVKFHKYSPILLIVLAVLFLIIAGSYYFKAMTSETIELARQASDITLICFVFTVLCVFIFFLKRSHGLTIATPTDKIVLNLKSFRRSQLIDFTEELLDRLDGQRARRAPSRWGRLDRELFVRESYN